MQLSRIIFTIIMIFALAMCSKSEDASVAPGMSTESMDAEPDRGLADDMMEEKTAEAPTATNQARKRIASGEGGAPEEQRYSPGHELGRVGNEKLSNVPDRLLEYSIVLNYESPDFVKSRARLLQIAGNNGYIINSQAMSGEEPYMDTRMRVQVDRMHTVLQEMDELGLLKSRTINSTDHTENAVLQEIRLERELTRQRRRGAAATATGRKDWQAREGLLSQSEDRADAAKMEQWKIKDRVAYAEIRVYLSGPEQTPRIEVPLYSRALIGLTNFLLGLSYVLLWLSPFIGMLALLIWFLRRRRWFPFHKQT